MPFGPMPFGQMPFGQMSVDQTAFGQTAWRLLGGIDAVLFSFIVASIWENARELFYLSTPLHAKLGCFHVFIRGKHFFKLV